MSESARRIVVTGVSRGLGKSLAEEFVRTGHTVIGCARSAEAIDKLSHRFGSPHHFTTLDVRDDEEVGRWASAVLDDSGPPDLLINNAGLINRNAPLWEVPAEECSRVIDVNIKGVINVIRHFAPAMVQRGRGVIANFSSGWGRVVAPEVAIYCGTKWAIEGLSRALAQELPEGMAALPVDPGIINTEMLTSAFGEGAEKFPDADAWARVAVPFLLKLGPADNGQPVTIPKPE